MINPQELYKNEIYQLSTTIQDKLNDICTKNLLDQVLDKIESKYHDFSSQIDIIENEFIETIKDNFNSSKNTNSTLIKSINMQMNNKSKEENIEEEVYEDDIVAGEIAIMSKKIKIDTSTKVGLLRSNIRDVLSLIEETINKTNDFEDVVKILNKKGNNDFLTINKDSLALRDEIRIKLLPIGAKLDYYFSKSMNKPTTVQYIDSQTEPQVIKISGTTCYTYYHLEPEITDKSIIAYFKTDIHQVNHYLYFGVINEIHNKMNACMCCNIQNAVYFRSNGITISKGAASTQNDLKHNTSEENLIKIRFMSDSREVYFSVNEGEEVGPFLIEGSKFWLTSGSCNATNGTIQLLGCWAL